MKKILLFALLATSFLVSSAQFTKGDRMVGATIATLFYNSGHSDITVASIGANRSKTTSYSFNINPNIGWFINSSTVVGLTVSINPNGQTVSYEQNGTTYQKDKQTNFSTGIGGFARHYFSAGSFLLPFGQASLNVGINSLKTSGFYYGGSGANVYKQTYSGSTSGGNFFNASLNAGFTKMVGENAGLDFYIGYNYSNSKNTFSKTTQVDRGNNGSIDETAKNETTTKYSGSGAQAGIGFQIFLRSKHK